MAEPGDFGFMVGLTAGANRTAALTREWEDYARGLSNQITELSQQLQRETAWRSAYRAHGAGTLEAINALPPEIRAVVVTAIEERYEAAFRRRAAELGLPHDYSAPTAREMRDDLIASIAPHR